MVTSRPLFRQSARNVNMPPVALSPDDTELFLRLADEGSYDCAVRHAMRRRGYLVAGRYFPHPRVSPAYHAFARPVAAWTLETVTVAGRRDLMAVLGRRRVGVLDIAEDASSTLFATTVHQVPSLMAYHAGLSVRPELRPNAPLPTTSPLDFARAPRSWVAAVTHDIGRSWPAMTDDIRSARWRLYRLSRFWCYDVDSLGDVITILDTPSGMLRVASDPDAGLVSLWPATPETVWDTLTDGPDVTALEQTESYLRTSLRGTIFGPLAMYRRRRVPHPEPRTHPWVDTPETAQSPSQAAADVVRPIGPIRQDHRGEDRSEPGGDS